MTRSPNWAGDRSSAEIENGREVFEQRAPDFLTIEIVGEEAKIGDVDVNALAVGDGSFRTETVLAMTAAGRMAGVELPLPVDFAGIQI